MMIRDYSKYDKESFINDLLQVDWLSILSIHIDDSSAMACTFKEIFQSIVDIHAPLKRKKLRNVTSPSSIRQ